MSGDIIGVVGVLGAFGLLIWLTMWMDEENDQ